MLAGTPIGSDGAANPSGWSNSTIFLKYLDHFIKITRPTAEAKHLIILDNHDSHVSVDAIQKAKDNNIVLLTIPPHTSHKLQPLDRTVFGPFKTHYHKAMADFMIENPGRAVTIYDVGRLAGRAYEQAFTLRNILSGFRSTGILPLNEDIFGDDEYLSSYVTDRPQVGNPTSDLNIPTIDELTAPLLATPAKSVCRDQPSTSHLTPEQVIPFPKAQPRKQTSRKRGKSLILTSTPVKLNIEMEKQAKTKVSQQPKQKRRLLVSSSSSDEENEPTLNDDDDISDWFGPDSGSEDNEGEFLEENPMVTLNDWVLVEFPAKRNKIFYVGQVTATQPKLMVNFLKRKGNQFVYPNVQDIAEIDITAVKKVFSNPIIRRGYHSFNCKFPCNITIV